MPCSLSSSCSLKLPLCINFKQIYKYPQVRSQRFSFGDDGGASANMVDANMGVLRERMEQVRAKEMKKCWSKTVDQNGWSYQGHGYDGKQKKLAIFSEASDVVRSASAALALVFSIGSLSILLVSLLVHLCY